MTEAEEKEENELIHFYQDRELKLENKNAELKKQFENYIKEVEVYTNRYSRNRMVNFCAHVVHKLANPESTMCVPNAIFIKVEEMLNEWEKENE